MPAINYIIREFFYYTTTNVSNDFIKKFTLPRYLKLNINLIKLVEKGHHNIKRSAKISKSTLTGKFMVTQLQSSLISKRLKI